MITRFGAVLVVASVLAAVAMATLASAHPARNPMRRAPRMTTSPCGKTKTPPRYRDVVWIVMENVGYDAIVGSRAAPYLSGLARACGLATNDHAVAHPSLPNYLALTSGTTDGITDDAEPGAHRVATPNLFAQLRGNWRALEESMPVACDRVTTGSYAARHDPAVYYTRLRSCAHDVVPLRTPIRISAAFTFITPNVCDDMHSCAVATGDSWLRRIVPQITQSNAYRAHKLVLFITWDESDTGPANHVATYVVAPSVPRGTRVGVAFTHYSLLRTTEQLLGLRFLGAAKSARSMLHAFRL